MIFDCSRKQGIHFSIFVNANANLNQTVKQNIGGTSIISERWEALSQNSALHLTCIEETLSVDAFVRSNSEEGFRQEVRDKCMSTHY